MRRKGSIDSSGSLATLPHGKGPGQAVRRLGRKLSSFRSGVRPFRLEGVPASTSDTLIKDVEEAARLALLFGSGDKYMPGIGLARPHGCLSRIAGLVIQTHAASPPTSVSQASIWKPHVPTTFYRESGWRTSSFR